MIRRPAHVPVAAAVGLGVAALVLAPVAAAGSAFTRPIASASSTSVSNSLGAFTATRTMTRNHLINGTTDQLVDSRTVTVKVSQTIGLHERQGVEVSWSGARPTQGLTGDPNSPSALQQEYPVVVLQCRGLDSTTVPVAKRLSPETCWTNTPLERYGVDYSFKWSPWRVDRYAAPTDRVQWVNPPPKFGCGLPPANGNVHFIPFLAANGTNYPIGIFGCAGIPPEAANISSVGLPDNATWAATGLDGKGSTRFDIRTAEDNASLGCSTTVACSIVVIPIMGISCDTTAAALPVADQPGFYQPDADAQCLSNGNFKPGEVVAPNSNEAVSVSGALWWSASNWRNRITVPLHLAPLGNICDLGAKNPIYFYGSELAIQATAQWGPAFCTNPKLFTFKHVQTAEPQARNLLNTGNVEAALSSLPQPNGYLNPTVTVPIAATGWVIGYQADAADGRPIPNLKLTPRLLAKLLTSSYMAEPSVQGSYVDSKGNPALRSNPVDITLDPEFKALNPTVPVTNYYTETAAALYALSSDSDAMYQLTAYINADPDARAWLDGAADPWGMVVNPNYKGISLPVNSWPLLDTFEPLGIYQPGLNDCLAAQPLPYLPLVASPTQRMVNISLSLQYALNFPQTSCFQPNPGFPNGQKLVTAGRQRVGQRFIIGVTSFGDAVRYGIQTAQLLTHTDPTAAVKFTDATRRTFVGPGNASIMAALNLMTPDLAAGVWKLDYAKLRTDVHGPAAYPGTVLINASIPTRGLPKADASRYVTFLNTVTTSGQVPGVLPGTLAAGFVPLSNGPAKLAQFAAVAGPAIAAQAGKVPRLLDNVPTPTPTPRPTPKPTPTSNPNPTSAPTPTSGAGGPTSTPSATPSRAVSASVSPTVSASPTSAGVTAAARVGPAGAVLPAVLALAVVAGLGSGLFTLRLLRAGGA